jgi:ligand-binding sensor domain-containing protein
MNPPIAGHGLLKSFYLKDLRRKILAADAPRVVFEDPKGVFWFGGPHGLFSYDEPQERWINHGEAVDGIGSLTWINAIASDKQARIWACDGFIDRKTFLLDLGRWRDANQFRPSKISSIGRILIAGHNGRMWFVSPEGLIVYDGSSWSGPFNPSESSVQLYNGFKLTYADKGREELEAARERMRKRSDDAQPTRPPWPAEIHSGIEDRDGDVWLGATRGIWRFDQKARHWEIYSTHGLAEEVSLITEDRYGRIWFADADAHLAQYDKRKEKWTSYDLAYDDAMVNAVFIDKDGQVLIGAEAGIIALEERTGKTKTLTASLNGKPVQGVSAIMEDSRGRIWVGTSEAILVLGG